MSEVNINQNTGDVGRDNVIKVSTPNEQLPCPVPETVLRQMRHAAAITTTERVQCWVTCISGFLQHKGRPNGITALWNYLRKYNSPTLVLDHLLWTADVEKEAEFRWRYLDQRENKNVIVGYSWGGQTAVNLCEHLNDRGIQVDHLILIDAVRRLRPWLLRWTAFVPFMRLSIPENVKEVTWYTQNNNLPKGHKVVAKNPRKTKIHERIDMPLQHTYADDFYPAHFRIQEIVEEICQCRLPD